MKYITDTIHVSINTPKITVTLKELEKVRVNFGNIVIRDSHDHYHGIHEVIPDAHNETILATADKVVDDDIVVRVIPYSETSNPTGFTAYIG